MALSKTTLKRVINSVPEPDGDDVGKWVVGVCRAIESEVRKQDEALILQLVDALCECAEDSQEQLDRMEAARLRDYRPNAVAWQEDTIAKAKAAIVAGRARLESKP